MNELPEQVSADANFDHRIASLVAEEDFGLRSEGDAEDESPAQSSHRERWIHVLEPKPVQPRIWTPVQVDRSLPVSLILHLLLQNAMSGASSPMAVHPVENLIDSTSILVVSAS